MVTHAAPVLLHRKVLLCCSAPPALLTSELSMTTSLPPSGAREVLWRGESEPMAPRVHTEGTTLPTPWA